MSSLQKFLPKKQYESGALLRVVKFLFMDEHSAFPMQSLTNQSGMLVKPQQIVTYVARTGASHIVLVNGCLGEIPLDAVVFSRAL